MSINPTPRVNSQYGAPMGRPAFGRGSQPTTAFELRRIRINQGGYADGGTYWGTGQPLYWYCAYATAPAPFGRCLDCNRGVRDALYSDACEHQFDTRDEETEISDYIRADSREHAKDIIRAKYPEARFKR